MSDHPGPMDGATPYLILALTVRFLIELALLVGAAVLAWHLTSDWVRWPAAIIAVLAVGTLWGLFLSRRPTRPLPPAATLALEAVLFVGVGIGLVFVGFAVVAVIGVAIWLVDRIALRAA